MKHIYLCFISLFFLFCHNIQAQCSWTTVGTGAASTATTTSYNDIALTPADVPYISYIDASLASAVVVKTYSAGTWQSVGSLATYTNSAYTSIAMDGTTPYVAFSDGSNGKKALVRKYTAGAWSTVGTAVSTGTANNISLAVYNGTPYIAYVDVANSYRATVKTFSAGAWTTLGTAVSTGTASYTSLSVDNSGTPYIIYQDLANSGYATVKKYNGTAWVAVGTGTVSTASATETAIDVSYNNIPYIAFISGGYVCSVKTFSASAWQSVGTGTIGNVYMNIGLAVDPVGTPYLGYYDLGSGMYKTSVMKYNGSAWAYAGAAGLSLGTPGANQLAIAKTGVPYLMIGDGSNGAYVKKLGSAASITLQPIPTMACVTSTTSLSIGTNTTGLVYQWQYATGSSFNNLGNNSIYSNVTTQTLNINANSTSYTGLYRCVANDGCINLVSNSASLTVNALPPIAANNATVCSGAAAILTATGGVTYSWNTGANTPSVSVTPTINTSYSVTGTDAVGCSATAVASVSLISSKTISGSVTSSTGPVSGNMILYRYSPVLSKWDSVAFTPFSSIYSFGTVDSSWYVVKAIPTNTSNVLVTYGSSAESWKGATTITHGCTGNSNHMVTIIPLTSIGTGTGSLSGKILEGTGFGQRPGSSMAPLAPGQPIGGIVVKGGRNPGGSMFAQTTTDANGTYTLSGLPNNAAGQHYFILVDIPGLDTNQTYHRVIDAGNSQYTGLDFIVDSARINPVPNVVSIKQLDEINGGLIVFPNPARNTVTIRYDLLAKASVYVELTDVLGRPVKIIVSGKEQSPTVYEYTTDISTLEAGLYFIKVMINDKEHITKFLITN